MVNYFEAENILKGLAVQQLKAGIDFRLQNLGVLRQYSFGK